MLINNIRNDLAYASRRTFKKCSCFDGRLVAQLNKIYNEKKFEMLN